MSWFEWLLGPAQHGSDEWPEAEEEERAGHTAIMAVPRADDPDAPFSPGARRALAAPERAGAKPGPASCCERVFVRIYDQGSRPGMPPKPGGSLHTGVEVYNVEWSFGIDIADEPTGVVCHAPGRNPNHKVRETLSMGFTTLSSGHVRWVVEQTQPEWGRRTFSELTRNSQHFSEALCYRLGVARLPSWVKDVGEAGNPVLERVFVRVYDLGQNLLTRWHNCYAKSYGAFHTGVEVYGREWSFGMTGDDWSTGITEHEPGQNSDHTFRETLMMGYTKYSARQVHQIINMMKMEWKGCTYNLFSRNCHNFTNALCAKLGVTPLPGWINELASTFAGEPEEQQSRQTLLT
mmetsp:Transcript_42283/g.111831  ORF Transcript_42283/g.111831 Transcript_42283/m.111831 type:complete len:348 (-) Transcript_42283:55-1098(-)